MPTQATPSSASSSSLLVSSAAKARRTAFSSLASADNSSPALCQPGAKGRKAIPATGKGSSLASRGQSNSRFKQKAALATRMSPKTPALLTTKRSRGCGQASANKASPPAMAMLTPGGIRQMRESTNNSSSRHADERVSFASDAAPSFLEQSVGDTSSILSENSTATLGSRCDPVLGPSFLLLSDSRDSFESSRDSVGSARLSTGAFVAGNGTDVAASRGSETELLQNKFVELQNENKALRTQLQEYEQGAQPMPLMIQTRLSFGSQSASSPLLPTSRLASAPTTPAGTGSPLREVSNNGYGEEQLQQLESNCMSLKEQDDKLGEAHSCLLHSLLVREQKERESVCMCMYVCLCVCVCVRVCVCVCDESLLVRE